MAKLAPARKVALALLSEQRRRDARIHDIARNSDAFKALDERDQHFVMRLVTGVNITRGQLDAYMDRFFDRPKKVEAAVRDAMRIATFEIYHLRTPDSVAVSQGVELVRSVRPYAAGMANAVFHRMPKNSWQMRAMHRHVDELLGLDLAARVEAGRDVNGAHESSVAALEFAGASCDASELASNSDKETNEQYDLTSLTAVSGYPKWLVKRLISERGLLAAARMCNCALEPAPTYTFCVDTENAPVPCDLSAQVVATIASAPNAKVLEVGQGRGTKSLLMAARGAYVVGCEMHAFKVAETKRRAAFYGLEERIDAVVYDGTKLADDDIVLQLKGPFDTVLVDAPCSGSGTMRRHPEIVWNLEEASLNPINSDSLPALQLSLLKAASTRVAQNGQLIYSTCSVFKAENEDVVEAFLDSPEGRNFQLADVFDTPGIAELTQQDTGELAHLNKFHTEQGFFQSYPYDKGPDGHFCCRMVRVS